MARRYPLFVMLASIAAFSSMDCCRDQPRTPSAASFVPRSYPVITRLVSRSQTITISAGPDCPLYSATLANGTRVVANLTLEELHDQQPALYRQVQPGIAVDSSER